MSNNQYEKNRELLFQSNYENHNCVGDSWSFGCDWV